MKMTMLRDYSVRTGVTLEAGVAYDSAKQNLSDDEVLMIYRAGCCEVEGMDKAPEPNVGGKSVRLEPQNGTHSVQSNNV